MITGFNVPRDQIYRFVTIGGRRFVSVHVARRWVTPWRASLGMTSQASTLEWILDWAVQALEEAERNDARPAA
ncbi:hypothetical protein WG936_05350 [Corynebacterium sp. H127]|uniref:hypothetical protein n=1 Tax=Corynebacterium sp. H127 TaxID=3133418 RepID=UPI0030A90D62